MRVAPTIKGFTGTGGTTRMVFFWDGAEAGRASPLAPLPSGEGNKKVRAWGWRVLWVMEGSREVLLDYYFLDGGDSRVGAEGVAEFFGFQPCFFFVVGLDQ